MCCVVVVFVSLNGDFSVGGVNEGRVFVGGGGGGVSMKSSRSHRMMVWVYLFFSKLVSE